MTDSSVRDQVLDELKKLREEVVEIKTEARYVRTQTDANTSSLKRVQKFVDNCDGGRKAAIYLVGGLGTLSGLVIGIWQLVKTQH